MALSCLPTTSTTSATSARDGLIGPRMARNLAASAGTRHPLGEVVQDVAGPTGRTPCHWLGGPAPRHCPRVRNCWRLAPAGIQQNKSAGRRRPTARWPSPSGGLVLLDRRPEPASQEAWICSPRLPSQSAASCQAPRTGASRSRRATRRPRGGKRIAGRSPRRTRPVVTPATRRGTGPAQPAKPGPSSPRTCGRR